MAIYCISLRHPKENEYVNTTDLEKVLETIKDYFADNESGAVWIEKFPKVEEN